VLHLHRRGREILIEQRMRPTGRRVDAIAVGSKQHFAEPPRQGVGDGHAGRTQAHGSPANVIAAQETRIGVNGDQLEVLRACEVLQPTFQAFERREALRHRTIHGAFEVIRAEKQNALAYGFGMIRRVGQPVGAQRRQSIDSAGQERCGSSGRSRSRRNIAAEWLDGHRKATFKPTRVNAHDGLQAALEAGAQRTFHLHPTLPPPHGEGEAREQEGVRTRLQIGGKGIRSLEVQSLRAPLGSLPNDVRGNAPPIFPFLHAQVFKFHDARRGRKALRSHR
jgi:hypothetical protein